MPRSVWVYAVVCLSASWAAAGNWPGWRGPTSNGVAPEGDYPTHWSDAAGVAWSAPLPVGGGSTPAVVGDKILLTGSVRGRNIVLALDWQGDELWQSTVGSDAGGKNGKASGANPSPATDGERVFVYFKSGDVAAVDLEGEVLWQVNLQEKFGADTLWWDLGTSPVLTQEQVIIAVMQTGGSYVAALDKQSGDIVWKHDRELGAPEEAAQSYSTPVVITEAGEERIVVLGADHVTCHRAADGEEVWRISGMNPGQQKYWRSIAGPVVDGDLVFAPYSRGDSLTAIRLGGSGDVTATHIAWHEPHGAAADVPTPVAVGGKVYVCRDKGPVVCREAVTGDVVWSTDLPDHRLACSSSPVLGGGHLYVTREDGTVFVLSAADGTLVSQNQIAEEQTVATPVLVDGKILLRTSQHLHCIAGQ
jgi:outer membrane protein assembly factor BamB